MARFNLEGSGGKKKTNGIKQTPPIPKPKDTLKATNATKPAEVVVETAKIPAPSTVAKAAIPTPKPASQEVVTQSLAAQPTLLSSTQEVAPAVEQPAGPSAQDLINNILAQQEQQKIAEVARQAELDIQAQEQRRAEIEPRIKGLKSEASVATQVGQQRLKDIFAATGAAAGTGAARQIAAEQGLQSQLGALDVEKAQQLAAVDRDIADIQSEKAFLERQIRAGTATAQAQAQLEALQAEQQAKAREAEINSEREFKLFEQSLEQFNEIEIINLKNQLEKDNTFLDAEIQRLQNEQRFEQDVALKEQARVNAERLENIKNSNRLKLASIDAQTGLLQQQLRGQQALDQQQLRGQQSLEQIAFRDQLDRANQPAPDQGLPLDTINQAVDNALGGLVNPDLKALQDKLIASSDFEEIANLSEQIKTLQDLSPDARDQKTTVLGVLYNNPRWFDGPNGPSKLASVLAVNGISAEELDRFEAMMESSEPTF